VLIGSHYLGELEWTWENHLSLNRRRYDSVVAGASASFLVTLLLEKFYVPPQTVRSRDDAATVR